MLQAGTLDGQGTVASDESRKQLERGVGMFGNEGWVMERLVKLSSRAYWQSSRRGLSLSLPSLPVERRDVPRKTHCVCEARVYLRLRI